MTDEHIEEDIAEIENKKLVWACKKSFMSLSIIVVNVGDLHRRSFVFIITFFKQLLDHSQENQKY